MIDREPSNRDFEADARLVADYQRRGMSAGDVEQLTMLFRDATYRDAVFRRAEQLAKAMIVPTA